MNAPVKPLALPPRSRKPRTRGLTSMIDFGQDTFGWSGAVGGALAPIEQVLVTLVDPQGRTFTKGELVDNYGYPDADPPGIFDEIIEEWEAEDAEYESQNPEGGPTP